MARGVWSRSGGGAARRWPAGPLRDRRRRRGRAARECRRWRWPASASGPPGRLPQMALAGGRGRPGNRRKWRWPAGAEGLAVAASGAGRQTRAGRSGVPAMALAGRRERSGDRRKWRWPAGAEGPATAASGIRGGQSTSRRSAKLPEVGNRGHFPLRPRPCWARMRNKGVAFHLGPRHALRRARVHRPGTLPSPRLPAPTKGNAEPAAKGEPRQGGA